LEFFRDFSGTFLGFVLGYLECPETLKKSQKKAEKIPKKSCRKP
jgi:hypothetical protein